MKRMLSLFISVLLISCYPSEPRLDDNAYELEQSSAAVGDIIDVIYLCIVSVFILKYFIEIMRK